MSGEITALEIADIIVSYLRAILLVYELT